MKFFNQNSESQFKTKDAVFILAFAMIMLNTDIHDARLKQGKAASRKAMTVSEFQRNLRGQNAGEDFPGELLEQMYNSIKFEAIEMPIASPTASKAEENSEGKDEQEVYKTKEEWDKDRTKSMARMLRRTNSQLHQNSPTTKTWKTPQKEFRGIYQAIFEVTSADLIKAFTVGTQSLDLDLVETCLGGVNFLIKFQFVHLLSACESLRKDLLRQRTLIHTKYHILELTGPHALVKDRRARLATYPNSIAGSELVDWFIVQGGYASEPTEGTKLGNEMMERLNLVQVFPETTEPSEFKNDRSLYTFVEHAIEWGSLTTENVQPDDETERDFMSLTSHPPSLILREKTSFRS